MRVSAWLQIECDHVRIDAAYHALLAVVPLGTVEPDRIIVGDFDLECNIGR
jgi:hypothetical protein